MHPDVPSSSIRRYRAYGLDIQSAIALPELESSDEIDADVLIEYGSVPGPLPENGAARLIRLDAEGAYLSWPYIGRFRAERSGRISVDPLTDNEQHLRFVLLGPVLGAFLHQRGTPLLHGSAVAVNGRALIFLGAKGAGKSTLAAAFAANGCNVLNDDIIPLVANSTHVSLKPGFPSLKLSPTAREQLLPEARTIWGTEEANSPSKVMISLENGIANPLPISAIFILDGRDEAPRSEPVTPSDGLTELLKNSYSLKFGEAALAGAYGGRLFQLCATLARDITISRILPPNEFQPLRSFASSIIREHKDNTIA